MSVCVHVCEGGKERKRKREDLCLYLSIITSQPRTLSPPHTPPTKNSPFSLQILKWFVLPSLSTSEREKDPACVSLDRTRNVPGALNCDDEKEQVERGRG